MLTDFETIEDIPYYFSEEFFLHALNFSKNNNYDEDIISALEEPPCIFSLKKPIPIEG